MRWPTLLASVALAVTSPAEARERSPAEWSQVAIDDLHFIRASLRENHPGPLDAQNPAFRRWFDNGFEQALALARQARSHAGYYFAIQKYVVGFQDGHLGALSDDRLGDDVKLKRQWPGIILGLDGDSFAVVESAAGAPPVGAVLRSCDGRSADRLADHILRPYLPLWSLRGSRAEYAPYLLIDEGNPFVRRPVRCTFQRGSKQDSVELKWKPIASALLARKIAAAQGRVDATTGIRAFGQNGYWITLASFNANEDSASEPLLKLIAELERNPRPFRDADIIVLDVRGNTGGNSEFGKRIAAALWGKPFVEGVPNSTAIDWRVSQLNLRQLERGNLPALEKRFGKDDPHTKEYAAFIDSYRAALKRGDTFFREDVPHPSPAPSVPMRAKVFLLADGWCHSACLDFADLVLAAPGVTQVGQETSADTVYIDNSGVLLPSGTGYFGWSMKVHRGRPRGNNVSYRPKSAWPGSMADTPGLERWIVQLARH